MGCFYEVEEEKTSLSKRNNNEQKEESLEKIESRFAGE
jgi:hypothetical protein